VDPVVPAAPVDAPVDAPVEGTLTAYWRNIKEWAIAISNGTADVFITPAAPYFQAAFKAHEVGVAKPDVKIYQAATSYLALDADQVLHIGDDAHADAWGAREAGLHSVWINPQNHPWTHDSPQPWTIRYLSEVADHFQV
jgi:putative hydrolase of the HAD superfamily